ncbi:MAG: hypothetical protein ACPGYY_01680 [Bacteroidia bacterium]
MKQNGILKSVLAALFVFLFVGLVLPSCDEEVDPPPPIVSINGIKNMYPEWEDSIPANTPFELDIKASNEEHLTSFTIEKRVNGEPWIQIFDTALSGAYSFDYRFKGTTGSEAGLEIYKFRATSEASESATAEITNIGTLDVDNDLLLFEKGQNEEPYTIYNFYGDELGSFSLVDGVLLDENEQTEKHDLRDDTEPDNVWAWPARWRSENGGKFKKMSASTWSDINTDADIEAAWNMAGSEESTVSLVRGDLVLMKLGGNGNLALIEILEVLETDNHSDYIQFRYKRQNVE